MSGKAQPSVVIVGGGFGAVACAKQLSKHGVRVTVIDRHDYNQFQPLLYQVATAKVHTSGVARPLRAMFPKRHGVHVTMAEVTDIDPVANTVTSADGVVFGADYLVLAVGAEPNFFNTPGAAEYVFPLYSVDDAERLRSRFSTVIEGAYRNDRLVDQGALNFVIVGAGATGIETAGEVAEAINRLIPGESAQSRSVTQPSMSSIPAGRARARSRIMRTRTPRRSSRNAVCTSSSARRWTRCGPIAVRLSDGREILTRAVVWAGGIKIGVARVARQAAARAQRKTRSRARPCRHRLPVDLRAGDVANTLQPDGKPFPQLGSSHSRRVAAPRTTSSPTSRARRGSRSTTATRASWR